MSTPSPSSIPMHWRCRDRSFDLESRTLVMGIVNVTPDSFSDGGRFAEPAAAIEHAHRLAAEGAEILDIGAESTRPGSLPVPAAEQLRRLLPVIAALANETSICLSVDTRDAEVALESIAAGAACVNDISALGDPRMPDVVARSGAGLVLMHMQGTPETMQRNPIYQDAPAEVRSWLAGRIERAIEAGIDRECLALDPGIGFGKAIAHTLELIARLDELATLGRPVVVGASRKSFLGRILDLPVDQRVEAGIAVAAIAVDRGARIVRTHDVAPTLRAVRTADAIAQARRASVRPSSAPSEPRTA